MPEIGTSGLMSGDGKRGHAQASVLAPILDSTKVDSLFTAAWWLGGNEFGTPAALDRPVLARNRLRG